MEWNFIFFFNSVLLGVGLAMDAFSVSLANGLHENRMKLPRMNCIAGTYAFFQFLMPLVGWLCVHTIVETFHSFQKFIPWIALALLLYIGIKMIIEAMHETEDATDVRKLTFWTLMLQGVATSIDALSVGFTISDYGFLMAFVCSLIIAAVTWIICLAGLEIGKRFGTRMSGKAGILGGCILIFIGLEIFVKGVFLS